MTDHLLNNVEEQKETFLDIVNDLFKRSTFGIKSDLRIPRDYNKAREICTKGKFSMYDNLPHRETHLVDGHVCVRIKDILKQTLALGVDIALTYYPDSKTSSEYKRRTEKIHGCKAMTNLLKKNRCVE